MSQPTIRRYSFALKKHIVEEIENGRMSITEARRRYSIGGNNTIYRWLRQFGKHPRTATKVYVQMKHEKDPLAQRDEAIRQLKAQKQALESALAQKELKLLMAESFLSAAEEHFGCEAGVIKKNFEPKPSTRPEDA